MSAADKGIDRDRIHAFPPILGPDPRVLILGTMPSVESLRKQQYYGHPRNHFWPLIYRVLGEADPPDSYEERVRLLEERGIAVWDVFAGCMRNGSLDQNIKDEICRDIGRMISEHPTIRLVVLNGTRAEKGFWKGLRLYGWSDGRELPAGLDVRVVRLPSTSPIPTRCVKTMEDKIEAWSVVAEYTRPRKTRAGGNGGER